MNIPAHKKKKKVFYTTVRYGTPSILIFLHESTVEIVPSLSSFLIKAVSFLNIDKSGKSHSD